MSHMDRETEAMLLCQEAAGAAVAREGWGARLSAPGYLDCTEWEVFDTEHEAREFVVEQYEVDPDTGRPLWEA